MVRKTGILGGTFNPPHIGHVTMAKRAMTELGLSRVIFIPSKVPPHKKLPEQSPRVADRLEMLRLAVSGLPFAEISETELERGGKSYTADTLRELKRRYPDDDFHLLLGSDMLYSFERWQRPAEIASMCSIAAFPREDGEHERLKAAADRIGDLFHVSVRIVMAPAVEVSSTELRSMIEAGRRDERIPAAVFDYIVRKSLYTGAY